jgi:hypothetical protein
MKRLSAFLLCATFTLCPAVAKPKPTTLQPVNLGAAAPFAVFGKTGVTNVPLATTVITGDLGTTSIDAVTGFVVDDGVSAGAGVVIGKIQDSDTGPEITAATHAQASLGLAITDAKGRACPAGQAIPCLLPIAELGGITFTPGVYTFAGVATLTGPVTLSGAGVYIFQFAGGLTVNPTGTVVLENGAQAADIFWVTTQATLNSSNAFYGNILSSTSVTFTAVAGGTALTGRALALTDVTFAAADTVTLPGPAPKH